MSLLPKRIINGAGRFNSGLRCGRFDMGTKLAVVLVVRPWPWAWRIDLPTWAQRRADREKQADLAYQMENPG